METSYYMGLAMEEAENGLAKNEVPVGCVLVVDGKVIARTHNMTVCLRDPLAHAEYLAAQQFIEMYGTGGGTPVFYITVEPCAMCHGILRRIGAEVYFGCYNEIFGTRRLLGECAGSLQRDERCVEILQRFYKQENSTAPPEKRISKS